MIDYDKVTLKGFLFFKLSSVFDYDKVTLKGFLSFKGPNGADVGRGQ